MKRALRPASHLPDGLPDLARFVMKVAARVNAGAWARDPSARNDEGPVVVTRAPGRLDVMGGIADYSGALVLQWPIREATRVALRPWSERRLAIVSIGQDGLERRCDVPLDLVGDPRLPYADVHAWFAADPTRHWAAYVAGVFHVLSREHGVSFPGGAAIFIDSDVPEAKGVSSSAAIEAATIEAVVEAWQVKIAPRMRAIRCQQVENLIVGAPCGVMDQMASVCGEADSLMALLCQPAELRESVRLPDGLGVWGIDSGIRHAVTGADYGAVRVGAFMGYRILADLAELRVTPGEREGHVRVDDPRWHGYLANVGGDTFGRFAPYIPSALSGEEFLARYQGTTDLVTRIDPSRRYAVRTPTAHPVYEHERVTEWARRLTATSTADSLQRDAIRLGALMYESHASYSACGLGSHGTARLVELARAAGPAHGIYGAKITGGGSGGTVALLADAAAGDAVRAIAHRYAEEIGRDTYVFEGSSPGAADTGAFRLEWDERDANQGADLS
jgi:L-arabinokinase